VTAYARPELPRITVLPQVSVQDSRVLLGDLLTPESQQTLSGNNRVKTMSVALAPLPGKLKTLDGRIVREKLAELGIASDRFSIQVPPEIRLERLGQTLLPTDIENLITERFLPTLPWQDVQLDEIAIAEPIVLPVGKVDVEFQRPARTDMARPFYLNVDFRVDGQLVKRSYLRTSLTIFDSVAVAGRDFTPSDKILVEDLRWERRPLRSTLQTPVREASFFESRKPRSNIAVGESLFEAMFVAVPLIRRGDNVTVVFDDGKIRVATQAQSLGPGSKGDHIRVMNISSRVELMAEVVDESTVRVVNKLAERTK
jgi:flagella basal body P-ring formation protein FlgA